MQCKDYYPLLLEKWSFDYREYYDSQIVIYGAGECGQALYQQMAKEGKAKNIVAWIDKYASKEKSEKCFFTIEPIEKLCVLTFEFLLIAVKDENLSMVIKKDLISRVHIPVEKIIWRPVETEHLFAEIL